MKNQKIINSFPFPNTDYSLKNMIKVDDNLYFTNYYYYEGSEIENKLYEYNLKTKNIRKILKKLLYLLQYILCSINNYSLSSHLKT